MNFSKRILMSIALIGVVMGLNGCINVVEEITFKKNGSGTYSLSYDLSEMLTMISEMDLGSMLGDEDAEMEKPDNDDSDNAIDEEVVEREPVVMDTTISFGNLIADRGGDDAVERPEFWKKVNMHINMDEPKNIMTMKIYFDFDDVEDVAYFQSNISRLGKEASEDVPGLGGLSGLFGSGGVSKFSFKKKSFKRNLSTDPKDEPKMDDEMEQQMAFLKMMMAQASYKVIYRFPRKVKSVSNENSKITGNGKTVVTEVSLLELMDKKANLNESIKMKGWLF